MIQVVCVRWWLTATCHTRRIEIFVFSFSSQTSTRYVQHIIGVLVSVGCSIVGETKMKAGFRWGADNSPSSTTSHASVQCKCVAIGSWEKKWSLHLGTSVGRLKAIPPPTHDGHFWHRPAATRLRIHIHVLSLQPTHLKSSPEPTVAPRRIVERHRTSP